MLRPMASQGNKFLSEAWTMWDGEVYNMKICKIDYVEKRHKAGKIMITKSQFLRKSRSCGTINGIRREIPMNRNCVLGI